MLRKKMIRLIQSFFLISLLVVTFTNCNKFQLEDPVTTTDSNNNSAHSTDPNIPNPPDQPDGSGGSDSGGSGTGDVISISGNKILLNGADFISRGLIIEGLLIPRTFVDKCLNEIPEGDDANIHKYCVRHVDSRDYLYGRGNFVGNDVLSLAIKNWNINTIRFNVLQVALDPSYPDFEAYLKEVKDAVALARSKKLIVFLAIFDSPANDDIYFKRDFPKLSLDDRVTEAAAITLAKEFGNDQGVVIELLNEPYLAKTDIDVRWRIWRDGGKVDYGQFAGHEFVGVNNIIKSIRSVGAKNAITVQPPSATFEQFPEGVVDPLNSVIYSAHSFLVEGDDENINWPILFGEFAKTHPFIMTAWNVSTDISEPKDQWCKLRGSDYAQKYLNYLGDLKVGVMGFSLDVNFSIIGNFTETFDRPSKISKKCGPGGGGEILQMHFNNQLPVLPNPVPVITGTTGLDNMKSKFPSVVTVLATDEDKTPLNYRISWGDGNITPSVNSLQTSNSFVYTYQKPGTYTVILQVTDARGGTVVKSMPITVK